MIVSLATETIILIFHNLLKCNLSPIEKLCEHILLPLSIKYVGHIYV